MLVPSTWMFATMTLLSSWPKPSRSNDSMSGTLRGTPVMSTVTVTGSLTVTAAIVAPLVVAAVWSTN